MKKVIKDGQTLLDLAIQEFGAWEAAIAIAFQNQIGITEIPDAGTELSMPDGQWNRTLQDWCKRNDVSPATARHRTKIQLRIFASQFTEEFS